VAYRLPGDRVALDLDGPLVEVEPVHAWAIQRLGVREYLAYQAATEPDAELAALLSLFRFVAGEAQPSWDIADHRGLIPATGEGMLRLPLELSLRIVADWLGTLPVAADVEEPGSVVDEVLPPGPLRDEVKTRLRAVKAA
jgi:hypothetical protein